MEKIVYFLGAGFSAPLGIPVMRDFLIRAKDLYFRDKEKYAHFVDVLQTIDRMHKAKTYFQTDLLNIEEILSILDMEDHVSGTDRASTFSKFIEDVIRAYTPESPVPDLQKHPIGNNYFYVNKACPRMLFGHEEWCKYGPFVCNLLRQQLRIEPFSSPHGDGSTLLRSLDADNANHYSVITLNYDLVFETITEALDQYTEPLNGDTSHKNLSLAKLHGSVGKRIVAPTWKKHTDETLRNEWQMAYRELCTANQLRILGYSLPVSDAYVRYLLEAAILNSEHLKKIDIICLDDASASIEKHYRNFIQFKFTRFRNADIGAYLSADGMDKRLWAEYIEPGARQGQYFFRYDRLEPWHEKFMAQ